MNNVIVLNAFDNHVPTPGVTHADEVIDGDIDQIGALAESTRMVMLQPDKAILVTLDGSDPAKAVVDPASPTHGFTYAAGVPFVLKREMAQALKFVCAVADETGAISVQELTR
ncbi:MAG: hypothetical protein PHP93_03430 [Kiritimatiellales bacterium]|jgi:hypothetical protein|nr:hypothetical protein [Kiritimatiellales bacterium]